MAKKKVKKEAGSLKLNENAKLYAFLATFLSIVGFIIAILAWKKDKYVMHYAKQSLIIFVVYLIGAVVIIIPFVGWVISPIIYLFGFILWIISWVYALSGEIKEIPILGQYAKKLNI
ncbi:MAG: hypothetical protein WC533_05045 [Candidatus Pacearchaeota archaeon]